MTTNRISVIPPAADVELPAAVNSDIAETYFTDESRLSGRADRVFLPRNEAELSALLQAAQEQGQPVTISGGRTGITGGAVPQTGWLVSTAAMNRILGLRHDAETSRFYLRVEPGVTLETLLSALAKADFPGSDDWDTESRAALKQLTPGSWIFPTDPTERGATLGGMAACNASGARTLHYGPMRPYVQRLRAVLAGGGIIDLKRGGTRAGTLGTFELELTSGSARSGRIPQYRLPDVKSAAGYFAQPDMDLIDLLIGSEGTLAALSELELELLPAPATILSVIAFFDNEADALRFVRAARGDDSTAGVSLAAPLLALEFFDWHALNLLREQKERLGAGSPIPSLPDSAHTAIFIELATDDDALETAAESLLTLLDECGSPADNAWTAMTHEEIERLKAFRHALPEAINQRIGERARAIPSLTKLGTDLAVPDSALIPMMAAYHSRLTEAGLDYVIFGHIGNNHVHVNILPRSLDEYEEGKKIYLEFARLALGWGGTISAEHGIGRLKKSMLALMFGEDGLAAMRSVKTAFDPAGLLNVGSLFDAAD